METLHMPAACSGVHTTEPPQMRPPSPPTLGKHDFPQICKNWTDANSISQDSLSAEQTSQKDRPESSTYDSPKSSVTADTEQYQSSVKPSSTDDGGSVPPFPVPRNLKKFEKAADAEESRRYFDVVYRLEKPLMDYVNKAKAKKKKLRLGPTVIRPVILGTTIADAKLCMVVLCDKSLEKRVTKFLKEQWVRDLCRSSGHNHPALEILVAGSAWPVSKILAQLPLKHENRHPRDWPFCGLPMCFFDTDSKAERIGTLGGSLRVFFDDGSSKLMGMTSGHVIQDFTSDTISDDTNDRDSITDSESDFGSSSLSLLDDDMAQTPGTALVVDKFEPADQMRVSLWESSSVMLPIWRPDTDEMKDCLEKYYDWTLVHLDDMLLLNHSRLQTDGFPPFTMPAKTELEPRVEIDIMILSAAGPKFGYLRTMPARIQLHPGKSFIDTHLVRPREDFSISNGDSGSWVIRRYTTEVYGHLVAADVFGDGYVVPLLDSLSDVKRCLAAKDIVLEATPGQAQTSDSGASVKQKPWGVEPLDHDSIFMDTDNRSGTGNDTKRSYIDTFGTRNIGKASNVLVNANLLLTRASIDRLEIAQ